MRVREAAERSRVRGEWVSECGWNRQAERILSAVLRFGPCH